MRPKSLCSQPLALGYNLLLKPDRARISGSRVAMIERGRRVLSAIRRGWGGMVIKDEKARD